jgi:hypothetical protein
MVCEKFWKRFIAQLPTALNDCDRIIGGGASADPAMGRMRFYL